MRQTYSILLLLGALCWSYPEASHASGATPVAKATKAAAATKANSPSTPSIASHAALVFDQTTGQPLYAKNADSPLPIASITKLMTSMVVLDARQDMDEAITIETSDIDTLKNSSSRLPVGTTFRREDLMRLALMASDNRAAAALGRSYPGGTAVFVEAMNAKARELNLINARFVDPTGLAPGNVASPADLALMVTEAAKYEQIREFSTTPALKVTLPTAKRPLEFTNTNALVKGREWDIGLSKTGFINEAGKCLVMQAMIASRPVVIVLLDSWGKLTRIADANRIKKWLEKNPVVAVADKNG